MIAMWCYPWLDDAETWESISNNINNAKQDAQYKMQLMKESHDKLQELVNAMKGDIKNLTVTQRKELFKLLGNTGKDALAYGKEWMVFSADVYVSILQHYESLIEVYAGYYQALDVVAVKAIETQNEINKGLRQIEENHRKLAEGLSGVVKDLGPVVDSSIRLKHSVDIAKPAMEELVQVTRKNAPIIAQDLQALDAKVPGFYTDFNMGIDLANIFMDSANKIASHKINVSAAARNIGNIDLSSALYDLGGDPTRIYNRANDGDLSFVLSITPIIGTGKEIGQLIKGEDLVTGQKYGSDDYAWGTLAVVSGGTTRVVGKVVGKIGDLEKKGKALEAAAKGGRSGEIVLDKVQTYEQARNKAMSLLGDVGADSQPFIGTMEKSAGYGKIVGRETADHKARWRLDYDPSKGMHINVEDFRNGKKDKAIKYAIPFEGDEETFKSLLKYLNK
ncbi:hypothetical protein pE33L466_0059 (plasmid) [Bacillus cereus E33L]|uniref:Pre-toxin TG domain-containing protein n=1 Tax=Bacillus cereus (strain ZK / E33L) TaxID=288681 RepID=Q4V233_BACCZ|nr:hypothetical protein pE33L466_0059 [Bacillus cereus E33L]